MREKRKRSMFPSAMIVALLGIAFSLWNAFYPASVPCWAAGCQIFKMAVIEGVSLWTIVAGALTVLFIAAFWGLVRFGYIVAAALLCVDIVLLIVMGLIAPCGACLVGALFLAVLYFMFRSANHQGGQHQQACNLGALSYIWIIFFIINVAVMVKSEFTMWPLPQAESTEAAVVARPVRIFVSPSCTACKQLINGMDAKQFANVSVYPVLENLEELSIIKELQRLRTTSSRPFKEDYATALKAKPLLWHEYLDLHTILLVLRVWRNQAHVVAQGGMVPLIEIQGVPATFLRASGKRSVSSSGMPVAGLANGSANLPIDFGVAGACGGATTPPCPE